MKHLEFIVTGFLHLCSIGVIIALMVAFPCAAAVVFSLSTLALFCWILGQSKNANLD